MPPTLLPPSQIVRPSYIPMMRPMPMWVAWLIELLHQRKGRPLLLFCLVMQAYLIRVNRAYIIDLSLLKLYTIPFTSQMISLLDFSFWKFISSLK